MQPRKAVIWQNRAARAHAGSRIKPRDNASSGVLEGGVKTWARCDQLGDRHSLFVFGELQVQDTEEGNLGSCLWGLEKGGGSGGQRGVK